MCVTSYVHDYMKQHVPVNSPNWNWDSYNLLMQIMKKLDDLDSRLKQENCVDPEKAKYVEQVRQHLKDIDTTNSVVSTEPQLLTETSSGAASSMNNTWTYTGPFQNINNK